MPLFKNKKHSNARDITISRPIEGDRLLQDDKKPNVYVEPTDSPIDSRRSSSSSSSSSSSLRLMDADMWSSTQTTPRGLSLASTTMFNGERGSISSCSTACIDHAEEDSPSVLPKPGTLETAGDIPIFDAEGNSRPFKSLYEGSRAIGEQQLVIFIRHFFCGACQSYLKALSSAISLKTYFTLPIPTSITIIGLGDPSLIPTYRSLTNTPFPIYTDPTRQLHKLLDMGWSLKFGRRAKYTNNVNEVKWIADQVSQMTTAEDKEKRLRGGAWWWVGGEFLIQNSKIVWCNRMKNYRDHSEMDVIKRLLYVDEA